ncbi:MAG: hypothetical protein ACPGVO_04720 [Spirulinaceae cyanobacterium]
MAIIATSLAFGGFNPVQAIEPIQTTDARSADQTVNSTEFARQFSI